MSEKEMSNEDLMLSDSSVSQRPSSGAQQSDESTMSSALEDFDPFAIPPRIKFTEQETLALLIHARAIVESAVCGEPLVSKLPSELADAPAHGLFVTLIRGVMRACKGQWANPDTATIGSIISEVARAAATRDMRMPSITEDELPYLKVDLSFLHDVTLLDEQGADRAKPIKIGEHGVAIRAGRKKKSVLLPQVAVENKWDAKTFLEQASAAAGVSKDAWMDPEVKVRTFRTLVMRDEPAEQEFNPRHLTPKDMAFLLASAVAAIKGETRSESIRPLLANRFEHEMGVQLVARNGLTGFACDKGRSLIDLTRGAARTMMNIARQKNTPIDQIVRLQILWQPMLLVADDYPSRHAPLVHSTILARGKTSWTVVFPKPGQSNDTVGMAIQRLNVSHTQWRDGMAKLTAFGCTGYNLVKPSE